MSAEAGTPTTEEREVVDCDEGCGAFSTRHDLRASGQTAEERFWSYVERPFSPIHGQHSVGPLRAAGKVV